MGRSRGSEVSRQQIADRIREYSGDEEFRRLGGVAATRRLLHELREAHNEERDFDLEIVHDTIACGANPNAREESLDEPEEEEELDDEDDVDDEEDDDDDDDEDEEGDVEDEEDDDLVNSEVGEDT